MDAQGDRRNGVCLLIAKGELMPLKRPKKDPVSQGLEQPGRRSPPKTRTLTTRTAARTTRLTVSLSTELLNRLRDAVYWTPRLTLTQLVEESLQTGLAQLESVNRSPFPPRRRELRPGRPPADQSANLQLLVYSPESVGQSQNEPTGVSPLADLPQEESTTNALSRN